MIARLTIAVAAAFWVAAFGVAPMATGPSVFESQRADEYRVKAAMLVNFARFVEWPPEVFATPAEPFDVCVLGADPFGSILDDALKGHMVGGRPMETRRIADVEPGCHLVFISGSEQKRMAVIADRLRATAALTVAEEEGFGAEGGMIELFTEGDSVRFNIYTSALEQSRLRASARLIALAANQKHHGGRR
jgi:hypothetical protein